MKTSLRAAILAASLSAVAAQAIAEGPSPRVLERAISAADLYVTKHYPQYDLKSGSVDVHISSSKPRVIEVIYDLPPGSLGGAPTLSIDPQSMSVVKATMGQ